MAESFFQKIKDEPLTKELAQKIMEEAKGESRGINFKTDWITIFQKEGEEGIRKLEKKMEEVGFPVKYKTIKAMGFYPLGLDIISILAIRDIFDFGEKDFQKLGISGVKASLFFKIVLKYFSSLYLVAKQAPKIWQKHYTTGNLKVVETNEEEKYVIVRIEDFKTHPLNCARVSGYLSQSVKIALNRPVACKETKCLSRGDNYHQFILKW